jgi:hypothetical protein
LKILYNFCSLSNCQDGAGPYGGLVMDAGGDLYGITGGGGAFTPSGGSVFKLSP